MSILDKAKDAFEDVKDKAGDVVDKVGEKVPDSVKGTASDLADKAGEVVDKVKDKLGIGKDGRRDGAQCRRPVRRHPCGDTRALAIGGPWRPSSSSTARPRACRSPRTPTSALPWSGPYAAGVGHALITMVEPHPDRVRAYNRWYEDDHFFDGAMQMPWMFSGRRFVATYDLQQLRYPAVSPVADPISAGKYISIYWITKDRVEDHKHWTFQTNARFRRAGHVSLDRTHVFTSFTDNAGTVYRSPDVPRARFSLLDPPAGLVVQVVDAPSAARRDETERWLLDEHLPSRVTADGPTTSAMVFRVTPPDPGHSAAVYESQVKVSNDGRRLAVLWFLDEDPRAVWDRHFTYEVEHLERSGTGETVFVAPFVPVKMGTDRYEDQLYGPG